jgi:hypothetical protein
MQQLIDHTRTHEESDPKAPSRTHLYRLLLLPQRLQGQRNARGANL